MLCDRNRPSIVRPLTSTSLTLSALKKRYFSDTSTLSVSGARMPARPCQANTVSESSRKSPLVFSAVVRLDARNADTAADEALEAVVVTEVEQAVDHEAERRGRAAGIVVGAGRSVRERPCR